MVLFFLFFCNYYLFNFGSVFYCKKKHPFPILWIVSDLVINRLVKALYMTLLLPLYFWSLHRCWWLKCPQGNKLFTVLLFLSFFSQPSCFCHYCKHNICQGVHIVSAAHALMRIRYRLMQQHHVCVCVCVLVGISGSPGDTALVWKLKRGSVLKCPTNIILIFFCFVCFYIMKIKNQAKLQQNLTASDDHAFPRYKRGRLT